MNVPAWKHRAEFEAWWKANGADRGVSEGDRLMLTLLDHIKAFAWATAVTFACAWTAVIIVGGPILLILWLAT